LKIKKNYFTPLFITAGETLTTFGPDIGKYFAAILSKIMNLRRAGGK
jgi:hypothetical protein